MKTLPQNDSAVTYSAELLRNTAGSVILAPTETVYGLICACDDEAAREKIYALKHRPESKQLAVFLPDLSFVKEFAPELSGPAKIFAEHFMPGPVTLVVPDGKGSTFGFRIPDHPFILSLLREYGRPLASTSANLSGEPAALNIPDALASLDGEPDLAVDGGCIPEGSLASTVIVTEPRSWKIVRKGPVTEEMLKNVL